MSASNRGSVHERWAHLRFSVVGQLLAAPPAKGELRAEIDEARRAQLAASGHAASRCGSPASDHRTVVLPGAPGAADPVGVLRRKVRADAGQPAAGVGERPPGAARAVRGAPELDSAAPLTTTCVALAERDTALEPVPSYSSIRRLFIGARAWRKRRRAEPARHGRRRARRGPPRRARGAQLRGRVRRIALWHWDCHVGSRKVLTARGEWVTPMLFGVLDDRSRLACHLQWYLAETAEMHRARPVARRSRSAGCRAPG